jgi:hypothetical protein
MISGAWLEPEYGAVDESLYIQATENLERCFSVVGLTEAFDASLMLLQSRFGWRDIRYVRENVGRFNQQKRPPTRDEREVVARFNQWDRALYQYAYQQFQATIEQAGPEFQRKLDAFQKDNQRYQKIQVPLVDLLQRLRHISIRAAIRKIFS